MARLRRRQFLGLAGALVAAPAILRAAPAIVVTDMLGRTVTLKDAPQRIVLLEARDVITMAVLHPNPAKLIVGWAAADRFDSNAVQAAYVASADRKIAIVGKQASDTISLEGLAAVQPDLVVTTPFMQASANMALMIERLGQFGIPVLFSSSASNDSGSLRSSPIDELPHLMRMWGAVLDQREKAEAFIAFSSSRYERVAQRLGVLTPLKTYFEVMSTYDDCCWAAGTRVWGQLLAAAGGRSLDGISAPWTAQISLEHLLAEQPEVYIATGGGYAGGTRPAIGPGLDLQNARNGLERLTRRVGFETLPAVRNRRVHGIWSGLISTPPLNPVFVEVAATWLHPEQCRDLDPAATLADINRNFLSTPIAGPLWASI
ncbi:MAG TPA: ABC transporter substrate-binding protein [Beijerinckiaceae bacterium]|jgi:iron complex transport system substrate-binding protein|nr:ABC transporter substrate-binding protein [Beijerinckiaceae bacterium]